jgi:hypothetical protein
VSYSILFAAALQLLQLLERATRADFSPSHPLSQETLLVVDAAALAADAVDLVVTAVDVEEDVVRYSSLCYRAPRSLAAGAETQTASFALFPSRWLLFPRR